MKDKIKKKIWLYFGLAISVFLALSYFVKINTESGANYIVEDSLLGIVIFHNPFILLLYLLIAIVLIVMGIDRK